MVELTADSIPREILEAYYPEGVAGSATVKGGEVNTTWLITDANGVKTILQRLSPIYDASVGEDYEVVAAHLKSDGWEMATPLKRSNNVEYSPDNSGRLWRAFNYIESVPGSDMEGDLVAGAALGGLLGALHLSLSTLDYQPKFNRPHSQDANYNANRLQAVMQEMPDPAHRDLSTKMLDLSRRDSIDEEPSQVIHGDPRIGNTLFRNNKPFMFIDWDGYKRANPLVDVGDMLQSTVGEVITKGEGSCSVAELEPVLEAYYDKTKLDTDFQFFMKQALAAARVIALDLGIRHLIDTVEDRYFVWDDSKFKSRLEFNLHCAERQLQVYKVLE